ncbi:MAG: type II toxin-antitoxin system HipA family toxin [Bdellovibrionales bacterium]
MKREAKINIEVWGDWKALGGGQKIGVLSSMVTRGKEIFSFSYDESWLKSKSALVLDPTLQLFTGEQFNQSEKSNFGMFLDSAPDRWGRVLQKRREAIRARAEKRAEQILYESDYLLGVHDEHRMGALRFKTTASGPFLDAQDEMAAPPFASLRDLEVAAGAIENDQALDDPEIEKWVRMLIAPGGSLGRARPKASVVDESAQLWIAKFPSRDDRMDTGLWEYLVYQLAKDAGIEVSEAQAKVFRGPQHTFLTKRFDRTRERARIHFASAMTMLGKADGAGAEDGTSYFEIIEFLQTCGARVDQDLLQLWRRIVFYMCVSNTDDHLCNHGFLLTEKGWILSPAFDLNPNPESNGLRLNVSESDNSQDLGLALDVAGYFRVDKSEAQKILDEIRDVVKSWRSRAEALGIARAAQEQMSRAFRLVEG